MSTLENIAYYQNRRDERPNQDLARHLVEFRDREGVLSPAQKIRYQKIVKSIQRN